MTEDDPRLHPPDGYVAVVVTAPAPEGETGYICVGGCGVELEINDRSSRCVLAGGHVICQPCAGRLKEHHPDAVIPKGRLE